MSEAKNDHKNCPYCDEVILETALKCKYCKSLLYDEDLSANASFQDAAGSEAIINNNANTVFKRDLHSDIYNNKEYQRSYCNYCQSKLKQGARFCTKCGRTVEEADCLGLVDKLQLQQEICCNCSAVLKPGTKYCTNCGQPQY